MAIGKALSNARANKKKWLIVHPMHKPAISYLREAVNNDEALHSLSLRTMHQPRIRGYPSWRQETVELQVEYTLIPSRCYCYPGQVWPTSSRPSGIQVAVLQS